MRTYPRNSPEAAARLVSLAALADGHFCEAELDVLDTQDALEQLGLSKAQMHAVMHGFCDDLLTASHLSWSDVCQVDAFTLKELMQEIDDPQLRLTIFRLCVTVAEADSSINEQESTVLKSVIEQWSLQREALKPVGASIHESFDA